MTRNRALFHGTNARRAIRIDREGLRTHERPRWDAGNRRYIYLTHHPFAAVHWGSWRKDVRSACFWIDRAMLDPRRLEEDPASIPRMRMVRHRGCIPRAAIARVGIHGSYADGVTVICYVADCERIARSLPASFDLRVLRQK